VAAVLLATLALALLAGPVVLWIVVPDLPERLRSAFRPRRLAERRFAAAVADGDFERAEIQARRWFGLATHKAAPTGERWESAHPIVSRLPAASGFLWYLGPWRM
jgi:hypothetical protein